MSAFEKVWERQNEMSNDYNDREDDEHESDCEICDYLDDA